LWVFAFDGGWPEKRARPGGFPGTGLGVEA
jgi:hypothetical protein